MISTLFLPQNVVKIKREQAWSYQNHIFLAGEKSQETIQMLTPYSLSLLCPEARLLSGASFSMEELHIPGRIRGQRRKAAGVAAKR